jgi:hypothetical protein
MQDPPLCLIIVAHDAALFLSHRIEGKVYDVAFAMQAKSPVFAPLVG